MFALLTLLALDAVVADVGECLSEVDVEATELAATESAGVELLHLRASVAAAAAVSSETGPHYGSSACQCIGIDGVSGMTTVSVGAASTVNYQRDLGSHCAAWDAGRHPNCSASVANKPSFCAQPWCYVDPCTCNLANLPLRSTYIPNGRIRGIQLYRSYATCAPGGSYAGDNGDSAQIQSDCLKPQDSRVIGDTDCECVGVANRTGTLEMSINGSQVSYPADAGSYCKDWHNGNHPACSSAAPPSFCSERWCYVDPCTCTATKEPASFLPGATVGGQPLYKSSATCSDNPVVASMHVAAPSGVTCATAGNFPVGPSASNASVAPSASNASVAPSSGNASVAR